VFTLADGGAHFSGLDNSSSTVKIDGATATGWTTSKSNTNHTFTVSGDANAGATVLYRNSRLVATVKATAPNAPNTDQNWSAVGYPDPACSTPRDNKVNTADVEIGPASGGTGVSGRIQPDLLIRRAARGTHFVGNGIYNGSGHKQRVHSLVHRTRKGSALVKIQNDGQNTDDIVVGGTPSQAGFTVHYFFHKKNITAPMEGHGYTFHLKPSATRQIRVVVRVHRNDNVGKERTWQILARSSINPFRRDCNKFTVTAT